MTKEQIKQMTLLLTAAQVALEHAYAKTQKRKLAEAETELLKALEKQKDATELLAKELVMDDKQFLLEF